MKLNIGIDQQQRKEISQGLARLQADTYILYLKTHFFHWNVTGPMFQPLHQVFEEQYKELFEAVDLIAERIRALGFPAPGTTNDFLRLATIKEDSEIPTSEEMVLRLVEGHETVARLIREIFPTVEAGDDQASLDVLTDRLRAHEKTAWMLRSFSTRSGEKLRHATTGSLRAAE
jgi:starvation-inducible DNA-binding protein